MPLVREATLSSEELKFALKARRGDHVVESAEGLGLPEARPESL